MLLAFWKAPAQCPTDVHARRAARVLPGVPRMPTLPTVPSVLFLLLLAPASLIAQIAPPELPSAPVTGVKLRQTLDQPLIGSWEHVELRDLLRKIGALRNVSVVLDRRIDPTVQPVVHLTGVPLRQGFDQIAQLAGGTACFPQSVVYVGPPDAARSLRTWIELKTAELSAAEPLIPERRQFQLLARHTWQWQDLATPAEILRQIAATTRLEIHGLDRVPHDLWAAAILPETTTTEALAIVLTQFDLAWSWVDSGQAIELLPITAAPTVEKGLKLPPRVKLEKALERLRDGLPDLKVQPGRGELLARGFVEDLEAAPAVMSSTGPTPVVVKNPTPIRNRRFTVKIVRTPILAVLRELEKSGIVFEYDAGKLRDNGIDLMAEVTVEVKEADVDEFFKAIFADQPVTWDIEGLTVELQAK